jgi:hypothetical protein
VSQSNQFIAGQVRHACRNLAIWNGLLLVGVIATFGLSATYYFNFFFGPFPADDQKLLAADQHGSAGSLLRYVELRDRQLFPTGMTLVSTVNGKPRESTPYFFTPVGDRVMLVLAESAADGAHLVGPLYVVPDSVQKEVIDKVVQKRPELQGRFLPVMVNGVAAYRVIGWIGLGILIPLTLVAVANLGRAMLYGLLPHLHPAARDPDRADEIDREVEVGPIERFGALTLTPSWLLQPTAFGLRIVPLHDVVWAFGRSNRGIHVVVLALNTGKTVYAKVPGKALAAAVMAVAARVPWALVGYDKERAARWQKQRAELIREAEARRPPRRGSAT